MRILDEIPEGYEVTVLAHVFEDAGVPVIKCCYRQNGLTCYNTCIPTWARRVYNVFGGTQERTTQAAVLRTLARFDEEQRNAALSVYDLGGKAGFIAYLGQELLLRSSIENDRIGLGLRR